MSHLSELKSYLIDENYLFDDRNNGNVIMLSGKWGAGKTHFWLNHIEPELTRLTDAKKAYVYISLYGKENTDAIKNEILLKSYEGIKHENVFLKRSIGVFGYVPSISFFGVRVDLKSTSNALKKFFDGKKADQAKEFLLDGGLICFDDIERKSKNIHLNDFFGLVTQLSQEMKCKIVLILNSDVFEGKDAVIFRNVKEKSINKYLYFSPTINELFDSVFDNEKYLPLASYKAELTEYLQSTNELNARLYIQVLDNCLEWITKGFSHDQFKAIVYITTFFTKHHFTLKYRTDGDVKIHTVVDHFLHQGFYEIAEYLTRTSKQLFDKDKPVSIDEAVQIMMSHINKSKEGDKQKSPDYLRRLNDEVEKHKYLMVDFIRYVYFLKVEEGLSEEMYMRINDFVENGILLKDHS